MSKTRQLAHKFRLPDIESGSAHWSWQDLMGSQHHANFTWDHNEGVLSVNTIIDGHNSMFVDFHTVARSLRIKEKGGFPDHLSGSREIAQYLQLLFLQGQAPVAEASRRPTP